MTKLTRISEDNYEKGSNTVQENLTSDDINILLEEYNEVTEITELKPGVHIRYFTIVKNKKSEQKLFRMGGTITKVDYDNKYIVLTNGKISWSVQINESNILYRKMTLQEVKDFYENMLNDVDLEVNKYKSMVEKLKDKVKQLSQDNDKLTNEVKSLRKIIKRN